MDINWYRQLIEHVVTLNSTDIFDLLVKFPLKALEKKQEGEKEGGGWSEKKDNSPALHEILLNILLKHLRPGWILRPLQLQ